MHWMVISAATHVQLYLSLDHAAATLISIAAFYYSPLAAGAHADDRTACAAVYDFSGRCGQIAVANNKWQR